MPRPERLRVPGSELGEARFAALGCEGCHVPDLGEVQGLYSDLLLHDLGSGLQEEGLGYMSMLASAAAHEGAAAAREWRTPPLWGLRDSAPYLHDGRAATIDDAIRRHGGEATAAARAYERLTVAQRAELRAFLTSLVAPGA